MGTPIKKLRDEWMKDPENVAEYVKQDLEFIVARAVVRLRKEKKLTQAELAEASEMVQSAIARLEGGKSIPKLRTLEKIAKAFGKKLSIAFV